jgi:hypothetical protein
MWQQLATLAGDSPATESVRVLLTAHDDPELARCVTADMLSTADPADVAFEFAFLLNVRAATFTATVGKPPLRYWEKIRALARRIAQDENVRTRRRDRRS